MAPGCAPASAEKSLDRLTRRVSELSRHVKRQQQSIDDLTSRLVVLQDRVDANRVALSRRRAVAPGTARPPVARRVPAPAPRPRVAPPTPRRTPTRARRRLPVVKLRSGRGAGAGTHRGATRKPIVLKLTGRPDPRRGGRARAPLAPIPTVGDRIPVVPMPGAPVARQGIGPEHEYRQAHALLKKRSFAAAGQAFSRMARRYPRHALADNATYWLAECFFRQGKVRRAAWVLRQLLKRYPTGNKAPSAMLKLALCERRLGRRARARKVLAQVMQLYPGSREARLAAARLKR